MSDPASNPRMPVSPPGGPAANPQRSWPPFGEPGGAPVPPPPPPSWAAPPPSQPRGLGRWPLLVAGIVVIGLVMVLGLHVFGSGGSGQPTSAGDVPPLGTASNGTFRGSGITFDYPPSWPAYSRLRVQEQEGSPTGEIGLGPSPDGVVVQTFHLRQVLTPADDAFVRAQINQVVTTLAQRGGGTIESPLTDGRLGNVRAFTVRIRLPGPTGVPLNDLLVFGFRGSTEYFVNCQSTTADEPQILAGCNEVLQTFHVS